MTSAEPTPTPAAPRRRGGGLLRSSLAVAAGTGLSRATGFLRVMAVTAAFGDDLIADAYNVANITPNLVYELLLGGILSATLVPVFVDHLDREGDDRPPGAAPPARRGHRDRRPGDDGGISAIWSVAGSAMLALTVVGVIAAPLIMKLFTLAKTDADAEALAEVGVPLMRWFIPQIFFYGMTALGTALLNARRSFAAPSFAPVLNNLLVSTVLVLVHLAHPDLDIGDVGRSAGLEMVIGLGTTAGIVAMTLVLLPAILKLDLPLYWNPDWRHPAVRQVVRLSGWTAGYVVSNQVALIVVNVLANRHAGDFSDYTYAFVFFQLPHGLLAVSLMTTFMPELARMASAGNLAGFVNRFGLAMRLLVFVVAPAAFGLVLVSRPLVSGLLVRGQFDEAAAAKTGDILALMALGLVGFSVYLFATRGFYCLKDTRTPFRLNVLENALNIAFGVALYEPLGVQGLGLAYALAYDVSAIVALLALRRRVGGLGGITTARSVAISMGASGVMLGLGLHLLGRGGGDPGIPALLAAALAVVVGVVLYGAATTACLLGGPGFDQRRLVRGRGERATEPESVP